jgi:hypothetical protein
MVGRRTNRGIDLAEPPMAKGKHKRKKQHAQPKAQRSAPSVVVVEKKPVADNETKPDTPGTNNAHNKQNPCWLWRFKEFVGSHPNFPHWSIAAFTCVLTAVAIYQFYITDSQLDVMRKEERAWLVVVPKGTVAFPLNVAPQADVIITNTGKSSATRIMESFYVQIVPNGKAIDFEAQVPHSGLYNGLAIPNTPQELTILRQRTRVGHPDINEPDPVTLEEQTAIANGKSWIAVHGIVRYRDIFGQDHWIKYCGWSGAKPGAYDSGTCTEYNSTDNQ